MRLKHKKDGNHGKNGWVSGNPRYKRALLLSKRGARYDRHKNGTMKGLGNA